MKKLLFILSISVLSFASCKESAKVDKAVTEEAKEVATAAGSELKLDAAASKITWVGKKVTGQHSGTMDVKEGNLKTDGTNITGGSFLIDINTLIGIDQSPEDNDKLAGHLKSPDFFDVAKFPTSKFEITSVAPYQAPADSTQKAMLEGATHTITGNLTLKDVTKSINFPAKVEASADQVQAVAKFTLNRADFNMSYGTDKGLKDKMIYPEVELGLNITAKK